MPADPAMNGTGWKRGVSFAGLVLIVAALPGDFSHPALAGDGRPGSTRPQPDGPARGTLVLHELRALDAHPGSWEAFVGLQSYSGPAITAVQLKLVADPSIAIQTVESSADLGDTTEWKLYTHLKPKPGGPEASTPDTMNVVLLSFAPAKDLPSGTYPRLLRCVFRLIEGRQQAATRNEIWISGVVAASGDGLNARVVPGARVRVPGDGKSTQR